MFNVNEQLMCNSCSKLERVVYWRDSGPPACACGGQMTQASKPLHSVMEPDENGNIILPALIGMNEFEINRFQKSSTRELDERARRLTEKTGVNHYVRTESDAERSASIEELKHKEATKFAANGITPKMRQEFSERTKRAAEEARTSALRVNADPDAAAYKAVKSIAPLAVQTGAYQRATAHTQD